MGYWFFLQSQQASPRNQYLTSQWSRQRWNRRPWESRATTHKSKATCFKDGKQDTSKKVKDHKTGTNKINTEKKYEVTQEGEGKYVLVTKPVLTWEATLPRSSDNGSNKGDTACACFSFQGRTPVWKTPGTSRISQTECKPSLWDALVVWLGKLLKFCCASVSTLQNEDKITLILKETSELNYIMTKIESEMK